jgi:drug/metabolite transporter (DMT)-like permease
MRTYLMLVLVMAFWGSAFASSKIAVHAVPHEVAAFLRFAIGAAILLVLHSLRSRNRLSARDLRSVAGLGLLGVLGYNVFFFFALSLAPSSDGSVIVPVTAPVITVAVTARLPAFTVTTFATTAGALALGVVAIPAFGDVHWSELGSGFWVNQAYLAALPTALAYVMYYSAVRSVGPATASSAMFLVPVFGLACSWLLLNESITPVQAAGSVLMFAGAWLLTLTARRKSQLAPIFDR